MNNHSETIAQQDAYIAELQAEVRSLHDQKAALLELVARQNDYAQALQNITVGHTAMLTFVQDIQAAIFKLSATVEGISAAPIIPSEEIQGMLEATEFQADVKGD